MMVSGQGMANQDRIGFILIESTIGFVNQVIAMNHRTAPKRKRRIEMGKLRTDNTDRAGHG